MVVENRAIEGESDEDGGKQGGRPQQQSTMRNAAEEPDQRSSLESPAKRDPLFVQLEGDGDADDAVFEVGKVLGC